MKRRARLALVAVAITAGAAAVFLLTAISTGAGVSGLAEMFAPSMAVSAEGNMSVVGTSAPMGIS